MISLVTNELPNLTRLIGQRFALTAVNSMMYEQDWTSRGQNAGDGGIEPVEVSGVVCQPVNILVDLRSTWSLSCSRSWRVLCPGAGSAAGARWAASACLHPGLHQAAKDARLQSWCHGDHQSG
jgi:hypothetical protein